MELFSVKDLVAREFGPPFMSKNKDVALRQFKLIIKDVPEPDEYALYSLGEFDPDTGEIKSNEPLEVGFG